MEKLELKADVTPELIRLGIRRSFNFCPLGLAITDAYVEKTGHPLDELEVIVLDGSADIVQIKRGRKKKIAALDLPEEANSFMARFDDGQDVEPVVYELKGRFTPAAPEILDWREDDA